MSASEGKKMSDSTMFLNMSDIWHWDALTNPQPKCFGGWEASVQFMSHVWLQQLYEWARTYGRPTPGLN